MAKSIPSQFSSLDRVPVGVGVPASAGQRLFCTWVKTRCDPSLKLDPGEAAAIALAEELKADWILLDERKGPRTAASRGLRVAGTLGIIEEAGAKGLLDYEQTRNRLVDETTFYVTDDVLRESEQRYRERRRQQERA